MISQSQLKLALVTGVIFLIGCQQPGQISQSGTSESKSSNDMIQNPPSDTDTPPVSDNPTDGSDDVYDDFSNNCMSFLNEDSNVNFDNAQDIKITSHSGQLDIEKGKSVIIQNVSGHLTVHASQALSVSSVSGNSKLRSNVVTLIENVSGSLCVHAGSILKVSSGSGNSRIVANSIDELSVQSGNLHIYKAKVRKAHALSGNICLHDGASIEELDSVSGHVKMNCPQ